MSYEEMQIQTTEVMCDEEWGLGMPNSQRVRRLDAAASQMRVLIAEVVDSNYFDSLTGSDQVPFTD